MVEDTTPLVVTRTFSKTWSMAAARLGYLVGPAPVVATLERVALPYHLDAVKQAAGRLALRFIDEMEARVGLIVRERHRLLAALGRLPVTAWPSQANFILFRPEQRKGVGGVAGPAGPVRAGAGHVFMAAAGRMPAGHCRNSIGKRHVPLRPRRGPGVTGPRQAERQRRTKETTVDVSLLLDGTGVVTVDTGLPFFDHMVAQLGKHAGFDLTLRARGDLEVDAHHTVEDTGIVLGECLRDALGDKAGVRRFASIDVPLDEALISVAVDLSGRPFLVYAVDPGAGGEVFPIGTPPFHPQLAEEFWRALVTAAGITLHLRMVSGRNAHHILEACFKGVARTLRDAVRVEGSGVPSTKGTL